ncbi:ABC transporter permease [Treponema primitia]|uniref:ABC transporter permease n=1 Tax=Treponema primitia TaxID=88058 RepID=UPI003980FC36
MMRKVSISTTAVVFLAVCTLLFLYLPIVVVVLWSFNTEAISSFPMKGLTLRWYGEMLKNVQLIQSLKNSIQVALISTLLAILIGVPGAYGMYLHNFKGKQFLERMVILPMMLPGIITGISILTFLQLVGVLQGPFAVILGHTTFLIGTVLPQVYTRLRQIDGYMRDAAMDLGASGLQTFVHVILPNIKTSIFGAALLSVTLSLDEIPVTFFLNGVFTTLPIKIFAMTRNGFTPEINAICSIILLFSVFAIVLSTVLSSKEKSHEYQRN